MEWKTKIICGELDKDMKIKRKKTAKEYYSDPLLHNFLNAVFKKYRGYGSGRGKINFIISSQEEAQKLQDFAGPRIRGVLRAEESFIMKMKIIEEELGKRYFLTIPSLYELLYQESLMTKDEESVKADKNWGNLFIDVIESLQKEDNIDITNEDFRNLTYNWLYRIWKKEEQRSGYRIVQSGLRKKRFIAEEFSKCMKALWILFMRWDTLGGKDKNTNRIWIPSFSNEVTRNPHALDRKEIAGRLFFRALEDIYVQSEAMAGKKDSLSNIPKFIKTRMIYHNYGLEDDSISSYFYKATLDVCELVRMETVNLSNVEMMNDFDMKSNLYLVENPSVFHYLVGALIHYVKQQKISLDLIKQTFPVLICTSGFMRDAVMVYIHRVIAVNKKCVVYFSGDFDLAGIEMLEKLKECFQGRVSPFKMDPATYMSELSVKNKDLSEADKAILRKKDNDLAKTMAIHGKKVYQEGIVTVLWDVLLKEIKDSWININVHDSLERE